MSHFTNAGRDTKSKRMWSEIHDITYEITASDFSAQLLEIHKIKTEMPIYNRRLRKNENLWSLQKVDTDSQYSEFELKPLANNIEVDLDKVFAIFRTKSQAKKSIEAIVREYKLCPKKSGLEKGGGECFSHQLGFCSGACVGKVEPLKYNLLVEQVFAAYRMRRWPFQGKKEILKSSSDGERHERFVVEDWILKEAEVIEEQDSYSFFKTDPHRFDYDTYKVLVKELSQLY